MKKFVGLAVVSFLCLPFIVSAQDTPVDCSVTPDDPNCLQNPIEADNLFEIISSIVNFLTLILVPLAVVMVIYAGMMFVLAAGNESKISEAKTILTNVLIGVSIILGARILVEMVEQILTTL